MLVMTSLDEVNIMYEPEKTVRHMCEENLAILNLYQNATIEACAQRYIKVYPLMRDFYHTIAALECRIAAGYGWPFLSEHKGKDVLTCVIFSLFSTNTTLLPGRFCSKRSQQTRGGFTVHGRPTLD
jgi:hypothetical protein